MPQLRKFAFLMILVLLVITCHTDSQVPEVRILQPVDGAFLSGTTQVRVLARDNEALAVADITIDNQVVFVNDSLDTLMVYDWDTNQEVEGSHTIIGYARDEFENEGADTISVFCGKPPYPDSLVKEISLSGKPNVIISSTDYLYIATENQILILDVGSNEIVNAINVRATDMDINSTVEYLYAPDGSDHILIIDLDNQSVIDSITFKDPMQGCLHRCDTIYYLLSFGEVGDRSSLYFIDLNSDSIIHSISDSFGLSSDITFANEDVYIPDYDLSCVWAVNDDPSCPIEVIDLEARPTSILSFTSQGEVYVATEVDSPGVVVISTGSNSVIDSIPGPVVTNGHALSFTPDGNYLFVADKTKGKIWVCSTSAKTVIDSISVPTGPNCLAVTPDGQTLYATSEEDSKLYVFKKR